jgi:hypothetical protein
MKPLLSDLTTEEINRAKEQEFRMALRTNGLAAIG